MVKRKVEGTQVCKNWHLRPRKSIFAFVRRVDRVEGGSITNNSPRTQNPKGRGRDAPASGEGARVAPAERSSSELDSNIIKC